MAHNEALEDMHLSPAVEEILGAGTPGAHLSVDGPSGRLQSCRGQMQVFGDANTAMPRPMTPDAAHDLGSVTKVAATTAMLMSLATAGRLTPSAPLASYLPTAPPDMRVRDLLHHRAGLWEWWPTYVSCSGPDEAIRLVTALPLRYPPPSGRHYSDLGFMIVGRVVEEVTGLRLPDAFAELVRTPLGLSGIRYGGSPAGTAAAASSPGDRGERRMIETGEPYPVPVDASRFDRWRNHVLVGEVDDGNAFHTFGGAAGHAGLFGTVAALHALGRALLDSASGRGIWSPDVVHEFWTNGPDDGQLLGFWSRTTVVGSCRAQAIGHTGFPGVGFAVLPEHDASVVLATNRLHVRGEPARFVPMWSTALDAAHATLHAAHQ